MLQETRKAPALLKRTVRKRSLDQQTLNVDLCCCPLFNKPTGFFLTRPAGYNHLLCWGNELPAPPAYAPRCDSASNAQDLILPPWASRFYEVGS